jgi:hypothetical protein
MKWFDGECQRLALDLGHSELEPAACFTGVVNREDVRVVEPSGEFDLPDKPLGAQRVRQLGMEDFRATGRSCRRSRAR